jgi:hypothetical protein
MQNIVDMHHANAVSCNLQGLKEVFFSLPGESCNSSLSKGMVKGRFVVLGPASTLSKAGPLGFSSLSVAPRSTSTVDGPGVLVGVVRLDWPGSGS